MDYNQELDVGRGQAPWMRNAAYNDYYTYSYISKSAFFAQVSAPYYDFCNRFVRNWLWWADGWVPYFHSGVKGIPSTRLASAIVEKAARKIVGGRVMYRNTGADSTSTDINPALASVSEWAERTDFERVVKQAVKYAAAAGTALLKLNKGSKGLWADALRFDSFVPQVAADGSIIAVDCYLSCVTDLGVQGIKATEGSKVQAYYAVERRYYGDYNHADGKVSHNVPIAEYVVKRLSGSITNGDYKSADNAGRIPFRDLPKSIRSALGKQYAGIYFDHPILLPFTDLGCELVRFSDGVTGLPELPFGESILAKIISLLQAWDYYAAAANTDMYLARGRVLLPAYMQKQQAQYGAYNSGIDDFAYTQIPSTNPDGQHPTPIQFDLRAGEWSEIRTRIIQDISINTGLNISTLASFATDNTARTAREISTEENETAGFVDDKRAIIEKPINRILRTVCRYMGYTDTVAIRWSSAGLTNRYALAELINIGLQGGFISRYKAVQMMNFDDDTQQVQEEYERIRKENPVWETGENYDA